MLRLALLVMAGLAVIGCNGGNSKYAAACIESLEFALTSPSSAVWEDVVVDHRKHFTEVRGQVDSDNSFRASLRRYFVCQISPAGIRHALQEMPVPDFETRMAGAHGITFAKGVGEPMQPVGDGAPAYDQAAAICADVAASAGNAAMLEYQLLLDHRIIRSTYKALDFEACPGVFAGRLGDVADVVDQRRAARRIDVLAVVEEMADELSLLERIADDVAMEAGFPRAGGAGIAVVDAARSAIESAEAAQQQELLRIETEKARREAVRAEQEAKEKCGKMAFAAVAEMLGEALSRSTGRDRLSTAMIDTNGCSEDVKRRVDAVLESFVAVSDSANLRPAVGAAKSQVSELAALVGARPVFPAEEICGPDLRALSDLRVFLARPTSYPYQSTHYYSRLRVIRWEGCPVEVVAAAWDINGSFGAMDKPPTEAERMQAIAALDALVRQAKLAR